MRTVMYVSLITIFFSLGGLASAAEITWIAEDLLQDTVNASEVLQVGGLVEAYNTGGGPETTINGVTFAVDADGIGFDTGSAGSLAGADMGIFTDLLDSHDYTGDGSGAVFTLSGLDAGVGYLLQVFIADNRGCCNGRVLFFGDNDGDGSNDYTSEYATGDVYNIVGEFVADAETQDVQIDIVGIEGWGHLNGYQLRAISGIASNPTPDDGQPEIPADVDLTLSWDAGSDPNGVVDPNITGHFVYFGEGTEPNELILQNSTVLPVAMTSYTISNTMLEKDTTYYWRVDEEVDNGGTGNVNTGPIWSFDTEKSIAQVDLSTPEDQFVESGEDAVFVVDASDPLGGTLTYNWYFDPNMLVSGDEVLLSDGLDYVVDGNSLTVLAAELADEGDYYCEVSNSTPIAVTSRIASLKIKLLLGHWPFDDDGTPATAADISGNGNDGTISGATYVDDGEGGKALSFGADGDRVELPSVAFDPLTTQFSIAVWMFGGESQPADDFIFQGWDSEGVRTIGVNAPWSNGVLSFDFAPYIPPYNGRLDGDITEDQYKGQWTHWVFSRNVDTGDVAVYYNGVRWFSGSSSLPIPGVASFFVGVFNADGDYPFDGMLKDFRLYNYGFSEDDAARLYYEMTGEGVCSNSPEFDLDGDCQVNLIDISILAAHWMECNLVPVTSCP